MKSYLSLLLAGGFAAPAMACDICAVYSAAQAHGEIGDGFFAGAAEQFTHFGTLQENGGEIANPTEQHLDSSISQVFVGYNFTERVGLQFTVPLIYRSFTRPEHDEIERGTVSGVGDVSLVGHFQILRTEKMDSTLSWNILGGIKFPTGDSARIGEELHEHAHEPGEPESGIHGHDLALGSGSYDGIIGTSLFARYKRAFASVTTQYAIRTRGDFGYEFADDLTWSGGPGGFLALGEEFTCALQLNISGEHKERDNLNGEIADDTGITSVFLGPAMHFTWDEKCAAELGVDVPVHVENTALQIVPDYRIRAALTWRF